MSRKSEFTNRIHSYLDAYVSLGVYEDPKERDDLHDYMESLRSEMTPEELSLISNEVLEWTLARYRAEAMSEADRAIYLALRKAQLAGGRPIS